MKRIFTLIVVLFYSIPFLYSQHQDITTGIVSPIFKHYTLSYEYILESDNSFGLEIGFGAVDEIYFADYQATPYYRYYYGEDANLFFVEGFFIISHYEYTDIENLENNYLGFAPGVGGGFKGIIADRFIIGLNFGVGYNFTKGYQDKIAKRGALFVGYRF